MWERACSRRGQDRQRRFPTCRNNKARTWRNAVHLRKVWDGMGYISISAVAAAGGFAFTASHLEIRNAAQPQVTKGSCPAIRCHRPSMAGGGYLGIHAEVAPCATPAFGLWKRGGRSEAKAKQQQRQQQDQKIAASLRSTAPTGKCVHLESGRPVDRLALAFAVHAPSRGRVEVLRSGQPGMDAGLAAPGHGWPMAAGPRSRTGARACRA